MLQFLEPFIWVLASIRQFGAGKFLLQTDEMHLGGWFVSGQKLFPNFSGTPIWEVSGHARFNTSKSSSIAR